MKKNIVLLLIVALLILPYKVNAACSTEKINDLKKIADNITVTTNFYEEDVYMGKYNSNLVTIYGLVEGLYAANRMNSVLFEYNTDGVVSRVVDSDFGNLNIYSTECNNVVLKTIQLDLKEMNKYYESEECSGILDEVDVCSKFYNTNNVSYSVFIRRVNEYKNNTDKTIVSKSFNFLDYIKEHIVISIGIGVILIAIILVLIISSIKRNRLD